jgi:hypothetical protein
MSIACVSSLRRLPLHHSRLPAALTRAPAHLHALRNLNSTRFPKQQFRGLRTMNAQELSQYFADSPPAVVRLEIGKHFEPLTDKQKRYAHFISR